MSDEITPRTSEEILRALREDYAGKRIPWAEGWIDTGQTFSMDYGLLSAEESAALRAKDYHKFGELVAARPAMQLSFFVAGGPTAEQLANLSGQCSETEWTRLCQNSEFLGAACRDLGETAAVASVLLGREISVSKSNPKKENP